MREERVKISSYLPALDHFGRIGKVHSVFDHSFNLIVNKQLINFTTSTSFLSSFGLEISQKTFRKLQPFCQQGNVVKLTTDSVTFYSSAGVQRVSFSETVSVSLEIDPIKQNAISLSNLKKSLQEKKLENRLGLTVGNNEQRYFAFLRKPNRDQKIWQEMVDYFIGRGRGLTPSGDDLLMGYLFVMKLYGHPLYYELERACRLSEKRTTSVSESYLAAMLAGYVSSPFITLQTALKQPAAFNQFDLLVKDLLKIGHTSGSDISYGIFLGIELILETADYKS